MADEPEDYPEDYDGCWCGDPDCPECNRWCHYCGGDGWGIDGEDWPLDDPINDDPGEIVRCPCCHGSGKAEDCTFW